MLVVVGMIASIRQVSKYIITKEIKCLCCVGGGGLKDVYNPDFVGRVVYKIFWD